jgi:hypothetical protein
MLETLDDSSKIWIYQSDRFFSEEEILWLRELLSNFTQQWTSHNRQLKASYELIDRLFIVLAVDQSKDTASGCSVDKSVKAIQSIENHLGLNLMDRNWVACLLDPADSQPQLFHLEDFKVAYNQGLVTSESLVYDNLIYTKKDLLHNWKKPLKNAWHLNYISRS